MTFDARDDFRIDVQDLSKRYGATVAVDHLSFTVHPGRVTGFLGPNGSGKSTTMRLIVGLDHPTGGRATIGGKPYAELPRPLTVVGALLEADAVHPGRSPYDHLLSLAFTQGIGSRRVNEVIDLVGLRDVARKPAGQFSLGMGQRLGIAVALLGDPQVLILDEPVNGLDPDGVFWFRNLMKQLAAEGRTVLVSSHLMNEMAVTAHNLIVIGRGRLMADCTTAEFIDRSSDKSVDVRSPEAERLRGLMTEAGGLVTNKDDGLMNVRLLDAARIGELAGHAGVVLHELSPQLASLEEAFMELTHDSLEYSTTGLSGADPRPEFGPELVAAAPTTDRSI